MTRTLYTIAATAKGGREGHVKSEDGVVDLPLGKPGSTSNPRANLETLFASGYSALSGALNLVAKAAGVDATESTVTATVTFGKTETGAGLAVALLAKIPGVDDATAQGLADKAHDVYPYSKATRGTIDVQVTGQSA